MSEWGIMRPPSQILFGRGVRHAAAAEIAARAAHVLLVTDRGVRGAGAVDPFADALRAGGVSVEIVDDVAPEFDIDDVDAVFARIERPDGIVGFGGGSVLDMAKLLALRTTVAGDLRDFVGEGRITAPVLPVFAVPTTAGTGSEVTPVAVVTDGRRGVKAGISSRHLVPQLAVVDPELTDGCPPGVTAASGIDALTHAVESYTARRADTPTSAVGDGFVGKNVLSDTFALEAVRLIGRSIVTAVTAPTPDARDDMALGSLYAGLAFAQAGTGLAHALQYPIGKATRTAHGIGVGLLLPYVLAFIASERGPELDRLAAAFGVAPGDLVTHIVEIRRAIGVPHRLSELGGDLGAAIDPARVAIDAAAIGRLVGNAGRAASVIDLEHILTAAMAGETAC